MTDLFSLCYSDDNNKNTFSNGGNDEQWLKMLSLKRLSSLNCSNTKSNILNAFAVLCILEYFADISVGFIQIFSINRGVAMNQFDYQKKSSTMTCIIT